MRRNYRMLSFLLSIALVMSGISVPAYAAGTVSGNEMASVSENDPIPVESEMTFTETESESVPESEALNQSEVESVVDESETAEESNTEISVEDVTEMASESETGAVSIDTQSVNAEALMPSVSKFMVNPAYEGILDKEAVREELTNTANEVEGHAFSSVASVMTTVDSVADYVREQMVVRDESITVVIPYTLYTSVSDFDDVVFDKVLAHTEECSGQEGDALYWAWKGRKLSGGGSYEEFELTWTMTYYTTAAQEEQLTEKVDSIMNEFDFTASTSEYDKIKAIHDYICDATDYDKTYTKYSAYDALCTGSAVCQGYAVACYRLCKEADISVRLVAGIGNGGAHGWNIVKIGNVYYNVDCTWDGQSATTYDTWFLLNETDFVDHTRDAEYATDEFYATYPMAQYSWGEFELLNLDNFEYTFTTLDEGTISSTADGKPKVLIFFRFNCSNSYRTIQSLAAYDLAGVDLYALEGYRSDKATVEAFRDTYGSDNIVFSYSTEYANVNPMWKYVRAIYPDAETFTYPVIAYIDSNNKLQYVTTSISSGEQISSLLQRACGYTEQFREYTITYNLDGGTNHAENPEKFTAHTDTITLKDANKTGYAFKGWYSDAEFNTQVKQIEKGTRENITLYAKFVKELELTVPSKTTYVVGESIDLTGGSVTHNASGMTTALTKNMISGFSTEEEGIYTITVTYQNCNTTFNVLVVTEPELTADYKQTLADIILPESEYGTYSWADTDTVLDKVGENTYTLLFTPADVLQFSLRSDLEAVVKVYRSVKSEGVEIKEVKTADYVYNGYAHKPEIVVYVDGALLSTEDYAVRYSENIDAGLGYYWVDGKNYYTESMENTFVISKADLTITAKDVYLGVGEKLPAIWEYTVEGLADRDTLVKEPVFATTAADTLTMGIYEIIPSGAEATENYNTEISYVNGRLQISEERVGYTVTFDVQGHGTAPAAYIGVKAGNVIERPQEPTADGYAFAGWYKDAACIKEWDFAADTVQADSILYAKWNVVKEDISFSVSEIPDVTYTGKVLKPAVNVYDGTTLLKANKDYKITWHNNINVNSIKAGEEFNESLPYVLIVGKGNYTDSVKINFNILPAVIGDGSEIPAAGVKLSYSDQLTVNTKKAVSPFKSIKLGKSMKSNVDFTVMLSAVNAKDAAGNELSGNMDNGMIPKGSSGTFTLTVEGKENYTGSISKSIVVTDKTHLIKNAKITLGKNLKKIDLEHYKDDLKSNLTAAYYDNAKKKYYAVTNGIVDYDMEVNANDVFTVKCGNTNLIWQKDFAISYQNNDKTGKATLVIIGLGDYLGSKSVTFELKGKTFNAKTVMVEPIGTQVYTGRPITLNGVEVRYKDGSQDGILLEYGKDYTITYTKHINKGKATMTFTAKGDSGYQGSFKKTFSIVAAPIASVIQDESMQNISVEYDRAGVKPAGKVILRNGAGNQLVLGKDYTVSYENNKVVADKNSDKVPTIVIKGKGNYAGDPLRVPFTITKASLDSDKITVSVKELAYNGKKDAGDKYEPAVKVMDGKKVLREGKDYKVKYECNTQEQYEAYYLSEKGLSEEFMPRVVITAVGDSDYVLDTAMEIALPVYQTKLAKANLHVVVSMGEYTGTQVSPEITVYYSKDTGKVKEAKDLSDEEAILGLGLKKLTKDTDYIVSYGKNVTAGKNKGTVTISGKSPEYGGSVTVKFNINSKTIVW